MLDPDKFYPHFLVKFIGSMFLVYGISLSFQFNSRSLFEKNIEGVRFVVLLAAILHSGMFYSIQNKSFKINYSKISLIFLKIISFTASFYVLTYVVDNHSRSLTGLIIKILLFGTAMWGAYRWAAGSNGSHGIQELLLAFGGMIGYLYLSGTGNAIIYWLVLLLMPIGWLFLYSDRDPRVSIFWFLCVFMMSGFPFSLTFQGAKELLINNNPLDMLLIIVPMIFVINGYIKRVIKKIGKFNYLESWYQVFYLFGLFLPMISMSAVVLRNPRLLVNKFSSWWIGLVILSLSIIVFIFQVKSKKQIIEIDEIGEMGIRRFSIYSHGIEIILEKIYILLKNLLTFISILFEGAGGMLWAVVFLALFITILKFQGGI
ncbi:MAG: hypothetical protein J7K66_03230 [Anaerolineaceae bacterium]|nr:hypothetical protein [Anaerolineaceae bacterium]